MENIKRCPKCGRELPITEFWKDKSRNDGLQRMCKDCWKKYYTSKREHILERQKQYYADNAESRKQYIKQYNAEHTEARKQYMKQYIKQYNAEHTEAIKQYKKQWYADNLDYFKQHKKQYRATIEGYARVIRYHNLQADRKQGRIGKDEDPLPTIEEYIELLQQPDFYDGKQYPFNEMGLDRIDNNKPHTIDNVVPATTEHNIQRGRKTFEEFCELIQKKVS